MPRSTCACRRSPIPTNCVPKILNLKSRTEGVSVKVVGELNRPPYEKGNAGAALYEHAKTLAAEIGFDLVDTVHRRRLRRQFHRAAYRNARRARRRRQGRAYPLRADVHLVDRAAGAAAAPAVPDAAMMTLQSRARRSATRRRTTARRRMRAARSSAAARVTSSAIHQADLIDNLLPHLALDIGSARRLPILPNCSRARSTMSGSKSDSAAANI